MLESLRANFVENLRISVFVFKRVARLIKKKKRKKRQCLNE